MALPGRDATLFCISSFSWPTPAYGYTRPSAAATFNRLLRLALWKNMVRYTSVQTKPTEASVAYFEGLLAKKLSPQNLGSFVAELFS